MRWAVPLVFLLVLATSAQGQGTPPRTPGRVGGSPNNPSVLRSHTSAPAPAALLNASALNEDEQKEYKLAQHAIPELTVYDFFQIENLSKGLRDRHVDIGVVALTQEIAAKKNHAVAALEQLGIRKKDAKKMYADAQTQADARILQLSQ
jgi:hypothetical protein